MQIDPLLEQIDWFFTSNNWTSTYPKTLVKPLGRPVSDHIPCVVSIETSIPRSKISRFESYWVHHPGFLDTVSNAWSKPIRSNNMATVISRKLKLLRHELKSWSKGISKLSIAIENSNRALFEIDELENKRRLTIPEANFCCILKKHIVRLLAYQKEY